MFAHLDHTIVESYLYSRAVYNRLIRETVPDHLGIIVTIPALSEPGLIDTIRSLSRCREPGCLVEVIALINYAESVQEDIKEENDRIFVQLYRDRRMYERDWLNIIPVLVNDLSPKSAGVGLARKIAMDEAVRRFGRLERDGIILCLDADCKVPPNYLREVRLEFVRNDDMDAASLYFEHRIDTIARPEQRLAIALYELHLRYYKNSLAWAGHPHAMYTIGSAMGVRASAYVAQGGMNRRKAGEDFYFLQKFVEIGRCFPIQGTCVYPSGRVSGRVPFGTGKAVGEYLCNGVQKTYAFDSIRLLREFIAGIGTYYEEGYSPGATPAGLTPFLESLQFEKRIEEIRRHTASGPAFRKRFFRWFNAFQAMKLLHHLRDTRYPDRDILLEAPRLAGELGIRTSNDPFTLLEVYRRYDQSGQ